MIWPDKYAKGFQYQLPTDFKIQMFKVRVMQRQAEGDVQGAVAREYRAVVTSAGHTVLRRNIRPTARFDLSNPQLRRSELPP